MAQSTGSSPLTPTSSPPPCQATKVAGAGASRSATHGRSIIGISFPFTWSPGACASPVAVPPMPGNLVAQPTGTAQRPHCHPASRLTGEVLLKSQRNDAGLDPSSTGWLAGFRPGNRRAQPIGSSPLLPTSSPPPYQATNVAGADACPLTPVNTTMASPLVCTLGLAVLSICAWWLRLPYPLGNWLGCLASCSILGLPPPTWPTAKGDILGPCMVAEHPPRPE